MVAQQIIKAGSKKYPFEIDIVENILVFTSKVSQKDVWSAEVESRQNAQSRQRSHRDYPTFGAPHYPRV
jgi:hypothetical protein